MLVSVFAVAVIAYGASTVDTASVGAGTSTPGAALGVKGDSIVEGNMLASSFTATSTGFYVGIGTNTPGAALGVKGGVIVDSFVYMSSFTATSTTATSTTKFGMTISSTTIVDGYSGRWALGTTTIPDADVANTQAVDPSFTIAPLGSADTATGILYIAGEGESGGQIIIRSSDGEHCISIMANGLGVALDASATSAATLLTTKVVACPR